MKIFYRLLIILTITIPLYSQELFDTKGKDFILTFLPNIHTQGDSDFLYIYVTADEQTDGYIEYTDYYGSTSRKNFTIIDAGKIYEFQINYRSYELEGAQESWDFGQCETIAQQKFRIVTNKDVTVYALNKAYTTSDAFLVLPIDVLGDRYFVMSYNSDGKFADNVFDTPSQFAVVAVEDETVVNIRPSAPTKRYNKIEQQVVMNKGDVYLVQANISFSNEFGDLTGTEILSNKPVAVFSGHQRSTIPYNKGFATRSRDCLIEQMPPVSTWGYNAFITPFTLGAGENYNSGIDLYRVLAARDSTKVTINGTETVVLNKGKFLERELTKPEVIEADKPILTAQFKRTANLSNTSSNLGDPFMVIIPPKEQYLNQYRVMNILSYDNSGLLSFNVHHITVVVPIMAIGTFNLDGKGIPQDSFKSIGNSKYAYANIMVGTGIHNLYCDQPFGTIVYGYGWANSYGYIGGMGMQLFDSHPPEITSQTKCYKASGFVTDTAEHDRGIESVGIPAGGSVNITASINRIDIKRFEYTAELTDKYFDGSFQLVARDSSGLKKEIFVDIPGFTVSSDVKSPYKEIITTFDTIELDKEKCYGLPLFNYGSHQQNNILLKSKSGLITFKSGNQLSLDPKQKIETEFCVLFGNFGHYTDTIIISDGCSERVIAAVDIYAGKDEVPPVITQLSDSCSILFRFSVSDSTRFDIGLKKISVINNINCHISFDIDNSEATSLEVSVINPYDDAFFKVVIEDSLGNTRTYEKEIPGFTITMNENSGIFNIGNNNIGYRLCDTLRLYNYGKYPITFGDASLSFNTQFSMPQSQFPITVEPESEANIITCYNPLISSPLEDNDSISLVFGCLEMSLPVMGQPKELRFDGENRCGLPFYITSTEVPDTYFIESIAPNPAVGSIRLIYGIPHEGLVSINIFDSFGRKFSNVYQGYSKHGYYKMFADISGLTPGVYFIVLSSNRENTAKQFLIE